MIFIYLFLVIVSVFFYILYEGAASLMILIFMMLLPPLMIGMTFHASRKISVRLSIDGKSFSTDQNIPVNIDISSNTNIPVMSAEITLEYDVSSITSSEKIKINTPIFPNNDERLSVAFTSQHYGIVKCRIVRVKIFDMLRMSRFRVPKKALLGGERTVMIIPDILELDAAVPDYSDMGIDSDNYSKDKAGDDPSEIFSIHEYSDGDKMSKIHWKLTAKQDKLMVKDYSLPIADTFMIVADTYVPTEYKERASDIYDAVIQLTFSLSAHLQQNGARHKLALPDGKNGSLEELTVSDDDSRYESSVSLLSSYIPKRPDTAARALLAEEVPTIRYAHLMLICAHVDESIISALSASGLAFRYTVLLCGEGDPPIPEDNLEIIRVDCDNIERSLLNMTL